jgi:hypothetical protein
MMYGFLATEIVGIGSSLTNEAENDKKNINLHVDRKWKKW